VDLREWLVRRIEAEARAYVNGDRTTRPIRWGRVLGFLEVGVAFGYWPKRTAEQVADSIYHRWAVWKVGRMLRRRSDE
jgi:hypothetical protein